jgi:N-acetyl-1-D-myo-inositol-2-amino-2-deoxy-alpha-D-glucopyranoside deacetylase
MNKQKVLLFVGAHPDDETFGAGAVLAQYAASGVKVYYLCATMGEAGTVDPVFLKGYASIGDLRWAELTKAVKVLGLAGFLYLGYRDSGMLGAKENAHPKALVNAPIDEVAGRIIEIFRQIKPDVVITHDPSGGYGHPDHIATYKATLKAFQVSSGRLKYPDIGPVFQPIKLYCLIRPHRLTKLFISLLRLVGRDPRHFGRNKDIDLVKILENEYPVNASVLLRKKFISLKEEASACHASQLGGRSLNTGVMGILNKVLQLINSISGEHAYFMRLYPKVNNKHIESDLFQEV